MYFLAGGLAVIERGVEARSGYGCPSISEVRQSDASRPERSFATLGQNKRPRESTDKTGPAKKCG